MKLHFVVTARPSWARVKHIVLECSRLLEDGDVTVLLVGPAVSKRYGDISGDIPRDITVFKFPTLQESDLFESVAVSSLMGGMELARFWSMNRPDAALIIADRTETLGAAVTASLMQIPLIHLQGGEISGSIDDKIRDANSKLADLHLTTNEYTKKRLESLGEDASTIHVVGCPSLDIVKGIVDQNLQPFPWAKDYGGVGQDFSTNENFGVIMFHPDTLNSDNLEWVELLIAMVSTKRDRDFYWFWFWPNPDYGTSDVAKLMRQAREAGKLSKVRLIINLEPEVFVALVRKARLMIGNSSFGIREASFLGLPVVNIGLRQSMRQRSSNVVDIERVVTIGKLNQAISEILEKAGVLPSTLYGEGDSGLKSAKVVTRWVPSLKNRKYG